MIESAHLEAVVVLDRGVGDQAQGVDAVERVHERLVCVVVCLAHRDALILVLVELGRVPRDEGERLGGDVAGADELRGNRAAEGARCREEAEHVWFVETGSEEVRDERSEGASSSGSRRTLEAAMKR